MNQYVAAIDDMQFEQAVLGSSELSIVDLWAEWCPPCRAIAPIFDAVAEQYAGRVRFYKLNIDDYPGVTQRFGVMSIPTLLVFDGGREVARHVGTIGHEALSRLLDTHAKVGV